MREFFNRTLTKINNLDEQLIRKYDTSVDRPQINVCNEDLLELKGWILRPNPKFAEIAFIGVGVDNQAIDKIYFPISGDFAPNAGYFHPRENVISSMVDKEEVARIFIKIAKDGRKNDIKILGHMHPSGNYEYQKTGDDGKTYREIINWQVHEGLLEPSVDDVKSWKRFFSREDFAIPYGAIAANTLQGPKLRVYSIKELAESKNYLNTIRTKFPYQTFLL